MTATQSKPVSAPVSGKNAEVKSVQQVPGSQRNGARKTKRKAGPGNDVKQDKQDTKTMYEEQMKNLKAHHVAKRVELRKLWVKNTQVTAEMAKNWNVMQPKVQLEVVKRTIDALIAEAVANHQKTKQESNEVSKTEKLIKVCLADFIEGGKNSAGKKFEEEDGLKDLLEVIVFAKENEEERIKMSKMDNMMNLLAEDEDEEDSEEEKELNRLLSLEIRSAYACEWAIKCVRRLADELLQKQAAEIKAAKKAEAEKKKAELEKKKLEAEKAKKAAEQATAAPEAK